MSTKLCHLIFLIAAFDLAAGQNLRRPQVPEAIKAPASEELVFEAHASGVQIYSCQTGADGRPAWVLKAPEAQLSDLHGKVIGRHFAGPTWRHEDGSQVSGKVAAKVDPEDKDAIPWLLVAVTTRSGEGTFSRVTTIQRIHTQGGVAPPASDCDGSRQNAEGKRPYRADYFFYAPAK